MENQNYQELIDNLSNPEKIKEAKSKSVNSNQTLKELKEYYHKVSHDDYYAAKATLDQNVELKKSLREEIKILESLKDKATLSDSEEQEVKRINNILEKKDQAPDSQKLITEKINQIEESLKELRILIKNSEA